ncbi:GGDEF domain-containing protein [Comamonas thiooxydans]|uniref:GGDEF domain-containing protein n=1 Tax=Comamonas thiooxydans TaxID=363952 RepID=UPI0018A59409|nr:GGDEF domain-containing protein [Comamonas thiooxydans]QOQ83791.1 GGDEF domain-containing protein [Comamonas thiooxydans]
MHTSNDYIYVLMPSLSMLFLAGLLGVCWMIQRQQRFLLWLCAAYLLTALSLSIRSVLKFENFNHYVMLVGTLFLVGAWCMAKSFADRRKVFMPSVLTASLCAASMASLYYFVWIEPSLVGRLQAFSIGVALVLLMPVSEVLKRGHSSDWLDQSLLWTYVSYAVFTMMRPTLVTSLGAVGLSDAMQANSTYWVTTLMSILFFALLFTVLICTVTIRETVAQLRTERDIDILTQILNRRAFHELAQRRLADQRLYPMAILAGDIDHFKRINDHWGHEKGDEVLQRVSKTMQHNVRNQDLLARFGGEEFVMLLTRIDLQGAEQVAKRIGLELRHDHEGLFHGSALTLSFGITSIANKDQLEGALKEADQLLYRAKHAGRDRVHVKGRVYPDISFENSLDEDYAMPLQL